MQSLQAWPPDLAGSPPPEGAGGAWTRAAPAGLALFVLAVFANALNGIFLFDDIVDVTGNPSAQAETFFARLWVMNRPLTKASYALQDALHGQSAAVFHGLNVVLHAVSAVLAFLLLRRAGRHVLRNENFSAGLAFLVTSLWAVHPALSETVTYVSGRSMGLSAMLILAMMLAATGAATRTAMGLAFACALLAPLARETALIAPAILLWWLLTVQPAEPRSHMLRRLLPALVGTAVAGALILLLPRHADLIAYSLRTRPPLEALQGNVHAAFEILVYWARPLQVTIDPAPPLSWPWDDARTLGKAALFVCLVLIALMGRRRWPLAAFGIGLALLALAPSNTLLWRADPVSLKPLYLGGLGLTLAMGALLIGGLTSLGGRRGMAIAVLMLTAVLGVASHQRNALFADEIALWRDAAARTPDYGRPHIMLGYALFNQGLYEEARDALKTGCDLDPLDEQAAAALELVEAILTRGQQ